MDEEQKDVRHQLEIYAKIFDNVDEEIMLLGKDLKILWANKKVLTMYDLGRSEAISEFCYKVTHRLEHPCKPPHDICPLEEVLRSGKPTTVLHTHFDKQGNKVYVEVSGYPVYEDGEISEFIHISRNVTERVMAEERLREHQRAIVELSTPVIKLWEGIIILPLIGVIDSNRAKQIMENLLQAIVDTQASIAIIDITGVPMVDTEVADRLIRTVKAAGLLGTRCIMVGIKPDIAQSIVNIGVDLAGVVTFSSLQAGLEVALKQIGLRVVKA